MLDISWYELLLIAFVALVVLGPEEFLVMMRKAGRFIKSIKQQASAFQQDLEQAADTAELESFRKQARELAESIEPPLPNEPSPPPSTEKTPPP